MAAAHLDAELERSGRLQTWKRTLELQQHLVSFLVNRTSAADRVTMTTALLNPDQSATCRITPAKPRKSCMSLKFHFDYLIVSTHATPSIARSCSPNTLHCRPGHPCTKFNAHHGASIHSTMHRR